MSNPPADATRMKQKKYCPVTLEPELEEIAALWPALKRLEMARKFLRWHRQLKVSGKIMLKSVPGPTCPRRALQFAGPRSKALN